MSAQIQAFLTKPVWKGGRTLHYGEIIVFAIALIILYWQRKNFSFKNFWIWIVFAMILLAMIIF